MKMVVCFLLFPFLLLFFPKFVFCSDLCQLTYDVDMTSHGLFVTCSCDSENANVTGLVIMNMAIDQQTSQGNRTQLFAINMNTRTKYYNNFTIMNETTMFGMNRTVSTLRFDMNPSDNNELTFVCKTLLKIKGASGNYINDETTVSLVPSDFYTTSTLPSTTTSTTTTPTTSVTPTTVCVGAQCNANQGQVPGETDTSTDESRSLSGQLVTLIAVVTSFFIIVAIVAIIIERRKKKSLRRRQACHPLPRDDPAPSSGLSLDVVTRLLSIITNRHAPSTTDHAHSKTHSAHSISRHAHATTRHDPSTTRLTLSPTHQSEDSGTPFIDSKCPSPGTDIPFRDFTCQSNRTDTPLRDINCQSHDIDTPLPLQPPMPGGLTPSLVEAPSGRYADVNTPTLSEDGCFQPLVQDPARRASPSVGMMDERKWRGHADRTNHRGRVSPRKVPDSGRRTASASQKPCIEPDNVRDTTSDFHKSHLKPDRDRGTRLAFHKPRTVPDRAREPQDTTFQNPRVLPDRARKTHHSTCQESSTVSDRARETISNFQKPSTVLGRARKTDLSNFQKPSTVPDIDRGPHHPTFQDSCTVSDRARETNFHNPSAVQRRARETRNVHFQKPFTISDRERETHPSAFQTHSEVQAKSSETFSVFPQPHPTLRPVVHSSGHQPSQTSGFKTSSTTHKSHQVSRTDSPLVHRTCPSSPHGGASSVHPSHPSSQRQTPSDMCRSHVSHKKSRGQPGHGADGVPSVSDRCDDVHPAHRGIHHNCRSDVSGGQENLTPRSDHTLPPHKYYKRNLPASPT